MVSESCGESSGEDDRQVVQARGPVLYEPGPTLTGLHDGEVEDFSHGLGVWERAPLLGRFPELSVKRVKVQNSPDTQPRRV